MRERSTFLGHLFEGFVASEICNLQIHGGRREEINYFRDQRGLEVDSVVPAGDRRLVFLKTESFPGCNCAN